MGRTACTEPQCLYKGDLYLYLIVSGNKIQTLRSKTTVYEQFQHSNDFTLKFQ